MNIEIKAIITGDIIFLVLFTSYLIFSSYLEYDFSLIDLSPYVFILISSVSTGYLTGRKVFHQIIFLGTIAATIFTILFAGLTFSWLLLRYETNGGFVPLMDSVRIFPLVLVLSIVGSTIGNRISKGKDT